MFNTLGSHFPLEADFLSYFTGARILRDGKGSHLYDFDTQHTYQHMIAPIIPSSYLNRFVIPPFFALFYVPFTYLPYHVAYGLFFFFNLLLLFFLLLISESLFVIQRWIASLAVFFFYPTVETLFYGQLSFVICFIFLLIYKTLATRKSFLSGILTALLLIKPQFLISFPFLFLLSDKKRSFLSGFLLSAFFILGISIVTSGFDFLSRYIEFIRSTENSGFGNRASQMYTLHGGLAFLFFNSDLSNINAFLINLLGYMFTLFLFLMRYKHVIFKYSFAASILFTLVFAMHILVHDLSVLIIPLFIVLAIFMRVMLNTQGIFAFLLFIGLFIGPGLSKQWNMAWLFVIFILACGVLLLYANKIFIPQALKRQK